jgi:hypothetical protein
MSKPGWGAIVQGELKDLEKWADRLKEPFDPWTEIHGKDTVLRSASLDQATSASDVRDRALAYIDRLNGAVALSQHVRPLRFGGVLQFVADGPPHRILFSETFFDAESFLRADTIRFHFYLLAEPIMLAFFVTIASAEIPCTPENVGMGKKCKTERDRAIEDLNRHRQDQCDRWSQGGALDWSSRDARLYQTYCTR